MSYSTGQLIGNSYEVEALLGQGGMSEVYKVWDRNRQTHMALKVLKPQYFTSRSMREQFQQEALALKYLEHPNIVRSYGLDNAGEISFIVMDFIEGRTLQANISSQGFTNAEIKQTFEPICAALSYAHQRGVVHCDLKPSNIMIQNNGKVLLADFGIFRVIRGNSILPNNSGTPAYMAPEQICNQTVVPQTDIYALGIILYEMATGRQPFTGERAKISGNQNDRIRWEHVNLAPVKPSINNPEINPLLEQIILRCLSKNPNERYPTPIALAQALASLPDHQNIQGSQKETGKERSEKNLPVKPLWVWLAAGVMIITLIFMLIRGGNDGGNRERIISASSIVETAPTTYVPAVTQTPAAYLSTSTASFAGDYAVHACMQISLSAGGYAEECVEGVSILPDGNMRIDFTWAFYSSGENIYTISPVDNNRNMYLVDNLGNRYDHILSSPETSQVRQAAEGDKLTGWFLFPEVSHSANYLIFHDDDVGAQTPPFVINWH